MSLHDNAPPSPSTDSGADTAPSRRRPGRLDDVPPSLIPLMRGSASVDMGGTDSKDFATTADDLAPARGITLAIVLSVPIWALLIRGVYAILH